MFLSKLPFCRIAAIRRLKNKQTNHCTKCTLSYMHNCECLEFFKAHPDAALLQMS